MHVSVSYNKTAYTQAKCSCNILHLRTELAYGKFINSLFNNAVSSSDYIASND
jgi:hypothetical protein